MRSQGASPEGFALSAEVQFQQDVIWVRHEQLPERDRRYLVVAVLQTPAFELFHGLVEAVAFEGDMVDGAGRLARLDIARDGVVRAPEIEVDNRLARGRVKPSPERRIAFGGRTRLKAQQILIKVDRAGHVARLDIDMVEILDEHRSRAQKSANGFLHSLSNQARHLAARS